MNNVDDAIDRLSLVSADPRIADHEGEWLADMVAHGRPRREAGIAGSGTLAALVALVIGFAGADIPRTASETRVTLAPFGPSAPLAPSTLLGEG